MTRFFSLEAQGAFSEAYSSPRNFHKNFNLNNLSNSHLAQGAKFSGNCAPLNI